MVELWVTWVTWITVAGPLLRAEVDTTCGDNSRMSDAVLAMVESMLGGCARLSTAHLGLSGMSERACCMSEQAPGPWGPDRAACMPHGMARDSGQWHGVGHQRQPMWHSGVASGATIVALGSCAISPTPTPGLPARAKGQLARGLDGVGLGVLGGCLFMPS